MKKKTLLIGLASALILLLITPTLVLAKGPIDFNASGTILSLSTGDVVAAGSSGRWVVQERELLGNLNGDLNGNFTLTYKANVEGNQAGNLAGKLTLNETPYVISLNGKSHPIELVWLDALNTYLPRLSISGHWTFNKGAKGNGDFEAWFIFIPQVDDNGNVHIGQILVSSIQLTGKYQP